MTVQQAIRYSNKRSHIVLIPGFAGFDALGKLEYYCGLTELFKKWKQGKEVLHYFDNFPTAAVATRARYLREYLSKRVARGEIFDDDDVTLVGHSTGGLDIRRLLWDLHESKHPILVDGREEVQPQKLLEQIRRVVFLSVPHWGTNIADWVKNHWVLRKAFIEDLRATVAGAQFSPVERVESAMAFNAASMTGAALFAAMQDALDEANEDNVEHSAYGRAKAQEAASELELYLQHIASDFRAIDDLTSSLPEAGKPSERNEVSPAHFNAEDRKAESRHLRDIQFRSYVTLGKRVCPFEAGKAAPQWDLEDPCTYPPIYANGGLTRNTDIMYRVCYRACAGGPFDPPKWNRQEAKRLSRGDQIEVWDNDGIVNTLSMVWPLGKNVLVHADHMDIVGQFQRLPAQSAGGRKYRTYDLLKSGSGFDDKEFGKIWDDIFAFALGRPNTRSLADAA